MSRDHQAGLTPEEVSRIFSLEKSPVGSYQAVCTGTWVNDGSTVTCEYTGTTWKVNRSTSPQAARNLALKDALLHETNTMTFRPIDGEYYEDQGRDHHRVVIETT